VQVFTHNGLQRLGGMLWILPFIVLLLACTVPSAVSPSHRQARHSQTMHISLERSGGFAGIPLSVTVDTDTLTPEDAAQLQQLVEAAHFFELPKVFPATPQPDRFQYQIFVEEPGRSRSVSVGETAVPPTLRPLINWLMEAARRR
jgi:hypothetical protein